MSPAARAHGASRYPKRARSSHSLLVNETFLSIQGEGPEQGYPTFFIRLAGCNLRCSYCDTTYAYFEGKRWAIPELVDEASRSGAKRVLVTGGEPLAQAETPRLCKALVKAGLQVSVETNGSYTTSALPRSVRVIADIKTPGSGEGGSFYQGVFENLRRGDVLKFVVRDAGDYSWARDFLSERGQPEGVEVLFSPAWGELDPRHLGEWLIRDSLDARMQVQLHKILWGDRKGA